MNIGCLGWGSLVWNPDGLPITKWKYDGPFLPLEFARQSMDGRLTLVLLNKGNNVPVLYSILRAHDLTTAITLLSTREGCARKWIGYCTTNGDSGDFDHTKAIMYWAQNKKLDAIIWTALPPKFSSIVGRIPTAEEAISYLATMDVLTQQRAEEYIRKAPTQIRTPYRQLFEQQLGWHPIQVTGVDF